MVNFILVMSCLTAPVPREAEKKGVQLTLLAGNTAVMAGDMLLLEIRLQNTTDQRIMIDRSPGTTDIIPTTFEIQEPGTREFSPVQSSLAADLAFRRAQCILDTQPSFALLSHKSIVSRDILFTRSNFGTPEPLFLEIGRYRIRATMKLGSERLVSNIVDFQVKKSSQEFQQAIRENAKAIRESAMLYHWSDVDAKPLSALQEKMQGYHDSNTYRLIEQALLVEAVSSAKSSAARRGLISAFMKSNSKLPETEIALVRARLLNCCIKAGDADLAAEISKTVDESILGVEELKKSAAALQPKK